MKNVVMLVRNSVSKDTRVLKEANSLIEKGYSVHVVGIQDAVVTEPSETLPSGLVISRVAWKAMRAKLLATSFALLSSIGLSLLILTAFYFNVHETLTSIFEALVGIILNESGAVFLFFVMAFLLVYIKNRLSKLFRIYRNELKREFPEGLGGGEKSSAWSHKTKSVLGELIYRSITLKSAVSRSVQYGLNQLFSMLAYYWAAREVLAKIKPDVIHAHDISTLPVGALLKKRFNIPLIYDAHEYYEEAVGVPKLGKFLYRFINRKYLRSPHVDRFITISDSFVELYRSNYPDCPAPTVIMNAAVRAEQFQYDGRLHDKLEISRELKIVLFQGGFSKKRGIDGLLEAAPLLRDDWVMVFMGWGFYESKIDKAAEKNPGKVYRIPPAPNAELVYWTSGASVGVIPYEHFGLNHKYCTPNKLWEYPNAGVPIVAAPRVELKRIVEGHGIGKVFEEPISPEEYAELMMFSDDEIRSFKKSCTEFIKTESWEKYHDRLAALYQEILV